MEKIKMKTLAIEDLMIDVILTFCENAAELGCPRDQEVDMWFRYLPYEEQLKVVDKMLSIQERDTKEDIMENTDEKTDKMITYQEIELDLEEHVIKGLCEYALKEIANDTEALINYAANKILAEVIETDGACLKSSDE